MAKKKNQQSLKERIKAERERLKKGGGNRDIIYIKADTTIRSRILNVGEENEWFVEVIQYYLPVVKGVFSPSTFGKDCAITDWYDELSQSNDEDDKALLAKVGKSTKYLVPVAIMDEKGKNVDTDKTGEDGKLLQLTKGLLTDTMDLFLDDEWGDFTDAEEGYDIKYTREGKGKNDTTYSLAPCKPTRAPKGFSKKPVDLEAMVMNVIPTYEETKQKLEQFLNGSPDDNSNDDGLDLEEMSRKELKTYIRENDLGISVKKSMTEADIVKKIRRAEKKRRKGDI